MPNTNLKCIQLKVKSCLTYKVLFLLYDRKVLSLEVLKKYVSIS